MYNQGENGYRSLTMNHYVYKITNKLNGKIYIGVRSCDCDIDKDPYMGSGVLIKKAIHTHGVENFHKEILETFETREEANQEEARLVTLDFVNRQDTYNLIEGGLGGCYWNTFSEEKKEEIKNKLRQHKPDPEQLRKLHESNRGVPRSAETKLKVSRANKGRIHTEQSRKNMSEGRKGMVFSEEHRKNISKANVGRVHSPETLEKIRLGNLGKKLKPETIEKLREVAKNRPPVSEETRRKLSEAAKKQIRNFGDKISKGKIDKPISTSKTVYAEGVEYPSVSVCARAYGISNTSILKRINSTSEKWKEFYYV